MAKSGINKHFSEVCLLILVIRLSESAKFQPVAPTNFIDSQTDHGGKNFIDHQAYDLSAPPSELAHDVPRIYDHRVEVFGTRDSSEDISTRKNKRMRKRRRNNGVRSHGIALASTFLSNPFVYIRDMWNELWDETSRLMTSSNIGYLWAIPVAGLVLYDVFVPKRVRVKRSFTNISELSLNPGVPEESLAQNLPARVAHGMA